MPLRYGVAVASVVAVLALKIVLDPLIGGQAPFLLLSAAVIVGAWVGGLGPGLLATALCVLVADYSFLQPQGYFAGLGRNALPLLLFAVQGVLISALIEALRSAKGRVVASALEAKNHREILLRSEERFRLLVEGVEDYAIFMLDPEGRVVSWNAGAERINGYRQEEIVGEHFSFFHTREDKRRHHPLEELRVAASEGRYREEGLRVRKDGSTFWASVLITALRDAEGNLRGFSKVVRDITERKEVERILQESERRFRALVQNSSDVITVVDAEGTIRYVSPAVERVSGYRPEELVGKSVFGFVKPDDLEGGRRIFADIWSQPGVHPPFEFRVLRKDGSWRHAEYSANNMLDDPGIRGVVLNQRDITERKEAEKRLLESEELHRTVVEQAAENIFLIDTGSKRIIEANAAFHASLGYTSEELERLTLYDVVDHDPSEIDRNVQRIIAGQSFRSERCYRRKDGTIMDVEVSASAIAHGGREVLCIVAHDITERKRNEDALRRSLNALLALYETGQLLGSSLARDEIALRLLEIAQRIFGLTAAVIALPEDDPDRSTNGGGGLRSWRSVGPEEVLAMTRAQPEVEAARREVLVTGVRRPLQLMVPSGSVRREGLTGLLLPLRAHDRVIGVLEAYGPGSLADKETSETLASLASQAASALENAGLYEELSERERRLQDLMDRMMAAQEEERWRVAYDVHDGLTQLAVAAHQRLQLFAQDYPPDLAEGRAELEELLGILQRTVAEARRIIAGLRPTTLDDFGLATAVRMQLDSFRAEGYEVDYEETLGEGRLPTTVETALFRIVQEALANARKHARADRVSVALERRGDMVRLEVRDWGRGFDPTQTTDGAAPGERVGLSSMRERVGLLGGNLEISSKPGEGTSVVAVVQMPGTRARGTVNRGTHGGGGDVG